jgi:uncharacterized damage-inducible protein DinB
MSGIKALLFVDLERELKVTRSVLAAVPADKFAWKPHEKSMSLMNLSIHVAELPGWINGSLESDVLDFATMEPPARNVKDTAELLAIFDKNAAKVLQTVEALDMDKFDVPWTMRQGEHVIATRPRPFVHRVWSHNHLIHHRGQLCLYLRLLNVPVPTVYFNTADDPTMKFD